MRIQPIWQAVPLVLALLWGLAISSMPPQPPQGKSGHAAGQGSGQKSDASQTWDAVFDNPTALSAVVVAVFTVVLTVVAFFQLRSLRHANETSRRAADAARVSADATAETARTMKAQLRAYLAITRHRAMPDKTTFQIIVENAGQTPAKSVSGHLNFWWDTTGGALPEGFGYPDFDGLSAGKSVAFLGPNKTMEFSFGMDEVRLRAAEAGEISLFVYGHFDYVDVFDAKQSVTYCYKVLPSDDEGGRMAVWGDHNETT